MFIYTGRRWTVWLEKTFHRETTCEKCNSVYAYSVLRKTSGMGRSPYHLDEEGAQQRAREGAEQGLRAAFEQGEVMPCPKCGWLQERMVGMLREHQWSSLTTLGITLASAAGAAAALTISLGLGYGWSLGRAICYSLLAGMGVGLIFLGRLLRKSFNPNANYGSHAGHGDYGCRLIRDGAAPVPAGVLPPAAKFAGVAPLPAAEVAEWYYLDNDQPTGPMRASELRARVAHGQMKPGDKVWKEGLADWAPASTFKGLLKPPQPPAAPSIAPPVGPASGRTKPAFPLVPKKSLSTFAVVSMTLVSFVIFVVIVNPMMPEGRRLSANASHTGPAKASQGNRSVGIQTALVGGNGGSPYEKASEKGDIVVGFHYELSKWDNQSIFHELEPLYGSTSRHTGSHTIVARDGYVAGGLLADGDKYCSAIRVIFIRRDGDRLALNDTYMSEWIGTPVDNHPTQLAGHGERVIGLCGRKGMNFDAIGLVVGP